MTVVRRSSLPALARRHRWLLCTSASLGPLALVTVVARLLGGGLTDLVSVPLAGSHIELWLVLSCYAGLVTCPLLSWDHADVEWTSPRFRSTGLLFPHALALLLAGVWTLTLVCAGPGQVVTFWVTSAMALAALATLVLGDLGWLGSLVGGFVTLDEVGQGHLVAHRTPEEAAFAIAAWAVLQALCLPRQQVWRRTTGM